MNAQKRDQIILKKIRENQKILVDTMKELRISSSSDLAKTHYVMRRGMVQIVGDIYELTIPLSEDTLRQLPLRADIIKQFRHTASHNYGGISDDFAFTCIKHCIDKEFLRKIETLIEELSEELKRSLE